MASFGISLMLLLFFSLYKSKRAIHMLQQNYYDLSNRYLYWIFKNLKKVFCNIDLLFIILLVFLFINIDYSYVVSTFTILYIFIFILYRNKQKKEQTKKPLVVTDRVRRIFFTECVIYFILILPMLFTFKESLVPIYYLILCSVTYLSYFLILIVNYINKPVEKLVFLHYKKQAVKKMKSMNIPVVGITGSYGKTSSKNIINDILNVKYNSFATPQNFNTTYGLINSINNYLDKFNDIFIAEMGAFKVGEIKDACKLMKPTHGVLTTIGEAHLESFGSRENIQKGKFELIESLNGGIAILNADDEWQKSYKIKNKNCEVVWIGIDSECDVKALNINLTNKGTNFDVKFFDDDKLYNFQTKLLGRHNVYNLLAGIALGYKLGMTYEELKRGVMNCEVTEHRLELKRSGNLHIIDDAYNSNPVGSKMALDVLKMMPGLKIVCTPGMIELGDKQYDLNYKFGEYIAESSDYVILVGQEQTKPIYEGLKDSGYDLDKVFVLNRVIDAFPLMNRLDEGNTYVLLENDLPDLFNE